MAGVVFDSWNFEETQLKMAWSKNILKSISIFHKIYQHYILLQVLIKKCCIMRFFNQKEELPPVSVVFLCILAGWESYMIGRALTGSPPCFWLVAWESYMIPSHTATHLFFIAIRIRVKLHPQSPPPPREVGPLSSRSIAPYGFSSMCHTSTALFFYEVLTIIYTRPGPLPEIYIVSYIHKFLQLLYYFEF